MNALELKELRARLRWSQNKAAEIISEALGRDVPYTRGAVQSWERSTPIPADVAAFLDSLAGGDPDELVEAYGASTATAVAGSLPSEDEAPGPGPTATRESVLLATTGMYGRICEELFELVATGVSMIGAAIGNDAVRRDGEIIYADKKALGEAYGKLAEQNETFRKMLESSQKQGAWLAVGLVTGSTVSRIYANHAYHQPSAEPIPDLRVVAEAQADGQPA